MNNLKSYTEYAVNTSTTDFVIGFDFNYGTDAVNVTVNGVPAAVAGYTVVYLNSTTMRLTPAVPSGVVRLERETDIDVPDNRFTAGAKFIASNMDENFTQIRHAQQEVRDAFDYLEYNTLGVVEAAKDATERANEAAETVEGLVLGIVPASAVRATSGENQQQINDYNGAKWRNKAGGYALNARAMLNNGDIVKSTVAGNIVNPNIDMTGWVNYSKLSSLNFDMFGVPKTNSSARMQYVFDESARLKIPVINSSGTYELNSPVTIKYDHDLTGTILKPKNTLTGAAVTITRDDTPTVEYNSSSSIVSLLKTGGVWGAKNPNLAVLANNTVLNNSYLIVNTSQPYYNYRGGIVNRVELLKLFFAGRFESGCYHDLDTSLITSVKAQKFAPYTMQSKGLSFDETDSLAESLIRVLDCNSVNISAVSTTDNKSTDTDVVQNKIAYIRAHNIRLDVANTAAPKVDNSPTRTGYSLSMNYCYAPYIKGLKSAGTGTATTSNNLCRRVTFEDCDLNVLDFHEPCFEYLKLINSNTGSRGVQCAIIGDIHIINNRQTFRPDGGASWGGYVMATRDDMGGWACGDLYIENHTIDGAVSTHAPLLFCGAASNYTLPVGSPIKRKFFDNIYIKGINVKSRHIIHSLIQANIQSFTPDVELPDVIEVDGLTFPRDHTNPLLVRHNEFKKSADFKELKISNSLLSVFQLGNSDTLDLVTLSNVKRHNDVGIVLRNMSSAKVVCSDGTKLQRYTELLGTTYSSYTPQVRLNNIAFKAANLSDLIETDGNSRSRIFARNVELTYTQTKGAFLANQTNKVAVAGMTDNNSNGFIIYFSSAVSSYSFDCNADAEVLDIRVFYSGASVKLVDIPVRIINNYSTTLGDLTTTCTIVGSVATVQVTATNITKILMLGCA